MLTGNNLTYVDIKRWIYVELVIMEVPFFFFFIIISFVLKSDLNFFIHSPGGKKNQEINNSNKNTESEENKRLNINSMMWFGRQSIKAQIFISLCFFISNLTDWMTDWLSG